MRHRLSEEREEGGEAADANGNQREGYQIGSDGSRAQDAAPAIDAGGELGVQGAPPMRARVARASSRSRTTRAN